MILGYPISEISNDKDMIMLKDFIDKLSYELLESNQQNHQIPCNTEELQIIHKYHMDKYFSHHHNIIDMILKIN